ncbi:MAG TPA: SAM-dependent methyltransferase [Gaiellaceae bacterium]|nr:SAM-dependent methyltransferase [Gaiellaceae bacterium]
MTTPPDDPPPRSGALTVVGTGIRIGVQLTPESRAAIDAADELLFVNAEPLGDRFIASLHPRARSLASLYRPGIPREEVYEAIVEAVLEPVRAGARVCAAFYGHPGVFVRPSHEAIARARAEGHAARMLPAVSAEDCLFADLGVDPASHGCASYDATTFLARRRPVDTSAALVLWQVAAVLESRAVAPGAHGGNLDVLARRLLELYPPQHELVLYEASPFPAAEALVDRLPLAALSEARPTPQATLYVPPVLTGPAARTPTR